MNRILNFTLNVVSSTFYLLGFLLFVLVFMIPITILDWIAKGIPDYHYSSGGFHV